MIPFPVIDWVSVTWRLSTYPQACFASSSHSQWVNCPWFLPDAVWLLENWFLSVCSLEISWFSPRWEADECIPYVDCIVSSHPSPWCTHTPQSLTFSQAHNPAVNQAASDPPAPVDAPWVVWNCSGSPFLFAHGWFGRGSMTQFWPVKRESRPARPNHRERCFVSLPDTPAPKAAFPHASGSGLFYFWKIAPSR